MLDCTQLITTLIFYMNSKTNFPRLCLCNVYHSSIDEVTTVLSLCVCVRACMRVCVHACVCVCVCMCVCCRKEI